MRDPNRFFQVYISKELEDESDKDALIFGRVYHEIVLEQRDIVTAENFMTGTLAIFRHAEVPNRKPDLVTDTERIWIASLPEPGVFRQSAEWGEAAREKKVKVAKPRRKKGDPDPEPEPEEAVQTGPCRVWHFASADNHPGERSGFCAFADMHLDGVSFKHIPRSVLTTDGKRMGGSWDAFEAACGHMVLMPFRSAKTGWEKLLNMRRRLRGNRDVFDLVFRDGKAEQTYVGECAVTGLPFQGRADWVTETDDMTMIPDLKSAWTLANWERQATNGSLYVQAVTLGGLTESLYDRPSQVVFIAQDKSPSYSSSTHWFEDAWLDEGVAEYVKAVKHYAHCLETGCWEHKGYGERVMITVPDWKRKQIMDREYAQQYWRDSE
jgi:hypothetical protein